MKPTILLTGATGFLGSHLLEALLDNGYPVVALKRSSSDMWRISQLESGVTFYDLDCTHLSSVFSSHQVDIVVHMATLYKKFEESEDISDMVEANVSFPSELLVESVKHGCKAFINTGTFFEYDCSTQPVNESADTKAFNFYAKTKLAFETILKTYSEQLSINTFKLFSPFGEKDNPKLVPMLIKKALAGEEIELSEGLQKLDLIYSQDVVGAYLKAIERIVANEFSAEYEAFNLGSGHPLSIRDVVSLIEGCIGDRLKVYWGEASGRDIPVAYADIEKARKLLGWSPDVGVSQGIANCIQYYEKSESK